MKYKNNKKSPIGIFDSGFGGLHIMKTIVKQLPQYDYIYLGDTARAPYGNRSQNIIYKFTKQAIEFLLKRNCQLIIIACNTASSHALRKIQQECLLNNFKNRKVLGVIIPASEEAVRLSKTKRIGVMATEATVCSGSFIRELKKININVSVFQEACPLFVSLLESGEKNKEIIEKVVVKYLALIIRHKIDLIILGCTHFGFLYKYIRKNLPKNIKILTEDNIVARKLKIYLDKHPDIKNNISQKSNRKFYTTDMTDKFKKLGSRFYGQKIKPEKIKLI